MYFIDSHISVWRLPFFAKIENNVSLAKGNDEKKRPKFVYLVLNFDWTRDNGG